MQPHDRVVTLDTNLVLDGDHRLPGTRHRPDVLEPLDLREHLLRGDGDELLDVGRGRPRERDEHVRHRDVDLRLFLAGCHDHCEDTEQQEDECDQRRQP